MMRCQNGGFKTFSAYEIWKAIHYTSSQKIEEEYGFTSETEFVMLKDVAERLKKL